MMEQKEITVNGVLVKVPQPYDAGYQINEAEAKALNQTYAENIANNCRKAVKELAAEDGTYDEASSKAAAKLVAEYADKYEFTLASVGGSRAKLDPLTKECRSIARDAIVAEIKKAGKTVKAWEESQEEGALKAKIIEVAENEQIVKLAKKRLAERDNLASAITI